MSDETNERDAAYWKRAFLAATHWPYDGLYRDLERGGIEERQHCDAGYVNDFETVRAALKRAGVRHG